MSFIGRNHTASERSRMSVGCTRLWLNKSSKCTRLAYTPPDYGRTTRPPAHTHTRTRSGRETAPCHEAGHCLFFRLGALFPEPFFVDHEVAVSTPLHTHAHKRIYADGINRSIFGSTASLFTAPIWSIQGATPAAWTAAGRSAG